MQIQTIRGVPSMTAVIPRFALGLVAASLTLAVAPALAQTTDCTHSALVKGEEGRYSIVLENNCSAPVKWSYNACAIGQSLESGIVTVGSGQTFQAGFTHTLLGTPQLLEQSCTGVCLNDLLTCSVSSALPQPTSEPLQDPSVLFPKSEPTPQLKPLSELLTEKPAAEPQPVLKPLDELLAEKPEPSKPVPVFTPVPAATPKLNAQTLPDNIGVKPVTTPAPPLPSKSEGVQYKPACVTSELKPRNFRGQGKLELTNHCNTTQGVTARICIAGETDIMKILWVKPNGKENANFPLPKNMTPRISMNTCQGEECIAKTPPSCR